MCYCFQKEHTYCVLNMYGVDVGLCWRQVISYIDEIKDLKEYINNVKTYESTQNKPVYNTDNAFTPAFIDFFCRKYGISHYAYDINKTCFMKYVHKNQNHRALCYYVMNNHMY